MDQVFQWLTQASLWLQLPLILVVVLPIAAVIAVVLLRIIDALSSNFGGGDKRK